MSSERQEVRKRSILQEKSFAFAVRVVNLYKHLNERKREFVLSKQLLRSGTAIGALIQEAQHAESRMAFIHKLGMAQKECDGTQYWLDLLHQKDYLDEAEYRSIYDEAEELLQMIRSAIITTKQIITK
ncbi:MAG: four helix bundle protein [Flavisolibacter sp.]|nr:four helix bundle protein [Flavisolibacter sp.]